MPLPIEKLQKFLKLEAERHFDNRAVVGGLDKILPVWEQEAREAGIGSELVDQIVGMIRAYPQKDPAAREELVNSILNLVRNEAAVELAEQPVPAQQTPAQTEPLPAAPVPAPAPAAPPEVVAPAPLHRLRHRRWSRLLLPRLPPRLWISSRSRRKAFPSTSR